MFTRTARPQLHGLSSIRGWQRAVLSPLLPRAVSKDEIDSLHTKIRGIAMLHGELVPVIPKQNLGMELWYGSLLRMWNTIIVYLLFGRNRPDRTHWLTKQSVNTS
jgi:hypothetical protein